MNSFDEPKPRTRGLSRLFAIIYYLPASDRILVHLLLAGLIASGIWFGLSLNNSVAETVPVPGGAVVEGVLGAPRFINPTLATTRADKDMVALVYDGVLTLNQDGELVPRVAEEVERSEDGTTYTIRVRDDIQFHDGRPLTAEDVAFTYELIKNPDFKSPLRGNWNNATITVLDEYTVEIALPEPYTPFYENLTVGIVPKHIWEHVTVAEIPFHTRNIEPVGSGPYQIEDIERTPGGSISSYTLAAHPESAKRSHLDQVTVRFFGQVADLARALRNGTISSTTDLPTEQLQAFESDDFKIITAHLPRVFGVFFNQNRSTALRNRAAREALSLSIDRERIVSEALHGYGVPTSLPVPREFTAIQSADVSHHPSTTANLDAAIERLEDDGWEKNENDIWERTVDDETITLSVTLRAPLSGVYEQTATEIVAAWEALGAEVRLEQYEQNDLLEGIIRPREFEAVLFGMDLGHSVDLYPFWHSSQQTDPGLNISQYASISTDQQLRTLRNTNDPEEQRETKAAVIDTLTTEVPAVFLFSSVNTHVLRSDITVTPIPRMMDPSDRLKSITSWHRKTATLWPIFHTRHAIMTEQQTNTNH